MLDSFLDRSILGYTRWGYALRSHPPIETDLRGKTIMVTGATSGLGRAAAGRLAELGAKVIAVGRNPSKLAATEQWLRQRPGVKPDQVAIEQADLSLMSEVRALATRQNAPLHALVNNAGVLLPKRTVTSEGFETTFATNLLGHFVLTNALIELLARDATKDAPSRIINVSSGGMYTQRLWVDNLQSTLRDYDGVVAYAQTKRAQVVLTELWAKKLRAQHIVVHAMHPGWADTTGVETSLPRFHKWTKPLLRSANQGADTIVWLAAADEAATSTGRFWHDRRPRPVHRFRRTKESAADRIALWDTLRRHAES